ncbi:MAG: GTP cyclohydrolase I FolE [Anaerolineaceae bacterium]|jgi:GTP cyclohydrolase I|nr:GTP cyclohydrolase I FolE [Anaerolineaceae bacterium]
MTKNKLKNCEDSPVYNAAELFCDSEIDFKAIEKSVRDILVAVGENPEREGLIKTPNRVARAYGELLEGYRTDPFKLVNKATFKANYDDMVIVRDIEFYSLCEHHMLPFLGRAHIAYLPKGEVIGLSKIPRIVDMFSRRLQIQEKMTRQIADFLQTLLEPRGVAVVIEAVHLCGMIRGVRKHDARMTTSSMIGAFRNNEATRIEFLDNISRGAKPMEF